MDTTYTQEFPGAHGSMTISNVSVVSTNQTIIGSYWQGAVDPTTRTFGTLTLTDAGSFTSNSHLVLGQWGGEGFVNVNGSATLTIHQQISVGENWGDSETDQIGYGVMNVNGVNAHVVQDTASNIAIGNAGGIGVWNQNAGLTETTSPVQLGNSDGSIAYGSGTLNLNGGIFKAPSIVTGPTTGGSEASTIATINFNGGTLQAAGDSTDFIANTTLATLTLNVLGNGAVIDTNSHAVTINQPFVANSAAGGLTKVGSGVLTLTAANTYTGLTVVKQGTLKLTAPASQPGFDAVLNTAGTARGVDIQGGYLVFDYGTNGVANPIDTIRANLATSYAAGSGSLNSARCTHRPGPLWVMESAMPTAAPLSRPKLRSTAMRTSTARSTL